MTGDGHVRHRKGRAPRVLSDAEIGRVVELHASGLSQRAIIIACGLTRERVRQALQLRGVPTNRPRELIVIDPSRGALLPLTVEAKRTLTAYAARQGVSAHQAARLALRAYGVLANSDDQGEERGRQSPYPRFGKRRGGPLGEGITDWIIEQIRGGSTIGDLCSEYKLTGSDVQRALNSRGLTVRTLRQQAKLEREGLNWSKTVKVYVTATEWQAILAYAAREQVTAADVVHAALQAFGVLNR